MNIQPEENESTESSSSDDVKKVQPMELKPCPCGSFAQFDEPENYTPGVFRHGVCCRKCKTNTMINVCRRLCKCLKIPHYNIPGETKALFCFECKTPEMTYVGQTPKKPEAGDSHTFKCRNADGSFSEYTRVIQGARGFNSKNGGWYGNSYKCPGADKALATECPYNRIGNKKYRFYCTECFRRQVPTDPLTFKMRSKTKEIATRDLINQHFEGFHHDKPLQTCGDCTVRRRIDHYKMFDNTLLSIETDENQHAYYSKEDEDARYNDIIAGFTSKHIFIRFNPDSFKSANGKKANTPLPLRLEILKQEIEKQIGRITRGENTNLIEIVYLFFDGYDDSIIIPSSRASKRQRTNV